MKNKFKVGDLIVYRGKTDLLDVRRVTEFWTDGPIECPVWYVVEPLGSVGQTYIASEKEIREPFDTEIVDLLSRRLKRDLIEAYAETI